MELLLVGLIKRERAAEEIRPRDRVAGRLNVSTDQDTPVAVGGSDAVQSNTAGGLKHRAGVDDGSYCHSRASANSRSLEHHNRRGQIAALPDLAAGERRVRGDDAFIPDAHWVPRSTMPAD